MPSRETLNRIKKATVALALVPESGPSDPGQTPFTIVGSGFCIDPKGIVITCEHVVSAFVRKDIRQAIDDVPEGDRQQELWPLRNLQLLMPHVLFFDTEHSPNELYVRFAPLQSAIAALSYDLGALRLGPVPAFRDGYPYLEVEPYGNLYEGMDVATCGFPMGNALQDQLGTKTSSFTRGILSSVAPAPGAPEEHATGFQLDLTATFGNSGGPVVSWETGRVFGVLQGGPSQEGGIPLPGIARAEPIYRILRDGTLNRLRSMAPLPPR